MHTHTLQYHLTFLFFSFECAANGICMWYCSKFKPCKGVSMHLEPTTVDVVTGSLLCLEYRYYNRRLRGLASNWHMPRICSVTDTCIGVTDIECYACVTLHNGDAQSQNKRMACSLLGSRVLEFSFSYYIRETKATILFSFTLHLMISRLKNQH